MASLHIDRLDENLHARLSEQAKRNARSVEEEAVRVLDANVHRVRFFSEEERRAMVEDLRRNLLPSKPGDPDSVALIRAVRDEE